MYGSNRLQMRSCTTGFVIAALLFREWFPYSRHLSLVGQLSPSPIREGGQPSGKPRQEQQFNFLWLGVVVPVISEQILNWFEECVWRLGGCGGAGATTNMCIATSVRSELKLSFPALTCTRGFPLLAGIDWSALVSSWSLCDRFGLAVDYTCSVWPSLLEWPIGQTAFWVSTTDMKRCVGLTLQLTQRVCIWFGVKMDWPFPQMNAALQLFWCSDSQRHKDRFLDSWIQSRAHLHCGFVPETQKEKWACPGQCQTCWKHCGGRQACHPCKDHVADWSEVHHCPEDSEEGPPLDQEIS